VRRNEALGGAVLFLFGVIIALLSLQLPIGTFRAAGSGLFPLCLGLLLMLLAALFLVSLRLPAKQAPEQAENDAKTPASRRQLLLFVATMVLATLLFNPLGYPLFAFLLMLALLRILGMKRWGINVLVSLSTAVVSHSLFVRWLQIPLPKGLLGL